MQTQQHDRIQQMTDSALERLAEALAAGQSETLKLYLATMAKFRRYSLNNQLLIAFQKPDATHVAGFNAWKKFNRFVRKGEHGILIMAPVTRRLGTAPELGDANSTTEQDVRQIVNVKGVYVFDVSQTDGEPLPTLDTVSGDPTAHTSKLKDLIASKGIALEYSLNLGGALGMSSGQKITILEGQTAAAEFAVLAHELAHELLHRGERRTSTTKTIRETEAEA